MAVRLRPDRQCLTRWVTYLARTHRPRRAPAIALAAIALAHGLLMGFPANAQSPLALGIFVGPPIPVALQPYLIRFHGATVGPSISITQITVALSSTLTNTVDVTVYLVHESSFPGPTGYGGSAVGPPLAAGTYEFRLWTADKYPGDADYRDATLDYKSTVVVTTPVDLGDAIEYHHAGLDHYFVTTLASEIAALDSGSLTGWTRTGEKLSGVFLTDPSIGTTQAPVTPVCRFYGLPSAGLNTHFFSASPDECAAAAANWPDRWQLETSTAFYVYPARATDGGCPDATWPVYRLYNNRPDVNHRYTTSLVIRQQMIDQGWIAEGYGGTAVAMCIQGP